MHSQIAMIRISIGVRSTWWDMSESCLHTFNIENNAVRVSICTSTNQQIKFDGLTRLESFFVFWNVDMVLINVLKRRNGANRCFGTSKCCESIFLKRRKGTNQCFETSKWCDSMLETSKWCGSMFWNVENFEMVLINVLKTSKMCC